MNYRSSQVLSAILSLTFGVLLAGCAALPNAQSTKPPTPLSKKNTAEEAMISQKMKSAEPDIQTRNSVKNLQDKDIKAIRLGGEYTGKGVRGWLECPDPKICSLFLNALKQAVSTGPKSRSRTSGLALIVKSRDNSSDYKLSFDYTTFGTPFENYGPRFIEALHTLGDYEAQQLHPLIAANREQVVRAEIRNNINGPVIKAATPKNSKELQQFLDELEHADSSIFAYDDPGMDMPVILYTKDKRKIPIPCVVRSTYHAPDALATAPGAIRRADKIINEQDENERKKNQMQP